MRTLLLTCLSLFALQSAVAAESQSSNPAEPVVEPVIEKADGHVDAPSRVARLSYKSGDVVMAPAGTDEWADALLNRPLTTGDRLWVDQGGRAELEVGSATVYLDEDSGFSFVDLDDDLLHMSLTDGTATIRVRRKSENEEIEIATPNATVTLLHPGEYHIQVTEDGAATVVSTRSGESKVEGEKETYTVRANEKGIFKGTEELTADIAALGPRSAFEDWANERERRDDNAVSSQYVSRDVIGYEDLDDNGDWISEPEYGYVWRPRYVVSDWAPYRFGRWVWVSPWGWNWVDDSRWGFAPFHYGRWAYLRSRWCWVPGPRHIRPVYAPALVAWVGGSGSSVSVSFGSGVGWFPLGPREVYVPGYWHSRRYIHNVNVSNTVIINNTYINNVYNGRGGRFDYRYGRMPRAVTVVSRDRFVGGRPLDGHFQNVRERDLRRWHHDGRSPAIAPDRSSILAGQPAARRPTLRPLIRPDQLDAHRDNGSFLARRAPPARVSFDAERRAIEANHGRPVDRSQIISNNNARTLARLRDAQNDGRRDTQRGNTQTPGQITRPERDSDNRGASTELPRQSNPNRNGPYGQSRIPQPQPSALQQPRNDRSNDRSEDRPGDNAVVRERHFSDRPAWARDRDKDARSGVSQAQPDARATIPSRQRDERRDDLRDRFRENRSSPPQQQAETATPGAAPQVNESRELRPWRNGGTATRERVEQTETRGVGQNQNRNSSDDRSWRSRREERIPSSNAERTPSPAPQFTAPREQPTRPVREQPQIREQPRVERSLPRTAPPDRPQRPERQQSQPQQQQQQSPSRHEGRAERSEQRPRDGGKWR